MTNKCIYPDVLTTERAGDSAVLTLLVPEALLYFDGHFDQASLLPGVVQIDWAVHFGRKLLDFTGEFARLEVIKFKDVISPNQQVELTLQLKESKNKLLFSYQTSSGMCSSGRVVFDKQESAARG